MKCYLNRGAFNNRAAPTFDDADMQKVITLGTTITTTAGIWRGYQLFCIISITQTELQKN